jgi:hypothetical protein
MVSFVVEQLRPVFKLTLAPLSKRWRSTATWLFLIAMWIAANPRVSKADMSALVSSRSLTTPIWPCVHATIRGVVWYFPPVSSTSTHLSSNSRTSSVQPILHAFQSSGCTFGVLTAVSKVSMGLSRVSETMVCLRIRVTFVGIQRGVSLGNKHVFYCTNVE